MAETTTLKLPATLKARIGPLARRSGKTPHAWMVEALEREAERAELREGFIQDALEAADEIDRGGPLYAAEDVRAYLIGRAEGKGTTRPKPVAGRRRR